MFSPTIIQQSLDRYTDTTGTEIARFSPDEILNWKEHLKTFYDPQDPSLQVKPFGKEEASFIHNERILSTLDFRHWRSNYSFMHRDSTAGGGIGTAPLWEPQELLLQGLAICQQENTEARAAGYPVFGTKIADHKARQLGHTQISREINIHALTLRSATRAIAISVDEDKVGELWDRDELILDNLPPWLRPSQAPGEFFRNVRSHMHWKSLGNRILYQEDSQQSGIGQGRQFERCHITEVASFLYPTRIQNDLIPALELADNVTIFESTAQGRGNWWHDFSEQVRKGERLGWVYHFTPWYAEKSKYRARPPADWIPSKLVQLHAAKCRDTSPEFFFGRTVEPDLEQLYWYERKREEARKDGTLNFFLANYCCTPSESFQHSNRGAFTFETLEKIGLHVRTGVPYQVQTGVN